MPKHPSKHESRQLSKKELLQLLADLDEAIGKSGRFASKPGLAMVVVGGAALTLEWGHRLTQDVDIISEGLTAELKQIIADVGERHYVREDWLNDATRISSPDIKNLYLGYKPLFEGEYITVYSPGVELILAMKLIAGRDIDFKDCLFLVRKTNITACEELLSAEFPQAKPDSRQICEGLMSRFLARRISALARF